MNIKKRGKVFYLWYTSPVTGKTNKKSLACTNRADANVAALEFLKSLEAAQQAGRRGVPQVTLKTAMDRALATHWRGMKGIATVEQHCSRILACIGADTPIASVGIDHYDALLAAEKARGNSDATCNRVMQTLSRILALAYEWRLMPVEAPPVPRFKEREGRKRTYKPAEIDAILAEFARTGDHAMRHLTVFLHDTGARLGELLAKHKRHLDGSGHVTFVDTKAGTTRTIPLTSAAYRALEAWDEAPLDKDRVEYLWARMRRAVFPGDPDAVIHALRHTCCTNLIRAGFDVRRVMMWMGHRDINTTLGYTHLLPGDLSAMVDTVGHRSGHAVGHKAGQKNTEGA